MLTHFQTKILAAKQHISAFKATLVTSFILGVNDAMAGNAAATSAGKLTNTMNEFLKLMPIASKIAGIVVLIGGMWSLYQHYKSQGRDGSIAAGIAGLGVGVGLFFLGGLLNFGADTIGVSATTALPT